MKAQIARGADFENGNLIQKVKNMVPLLVPLFISSTSAGQMILLWQWRQDAIMEERRELK